MQTSVFLSSDLVSWSIFCIIDYKVIYKVGMFKHEKI